MTKYPYVIEQGGDFTYVAQRNLSEDEAAEYIEIGIGDKTFYAKSYASLEDIRVGSASLAAGMLIQHGERVVFVENFVEHVQVLSEQEEDDEHLRLPAHVVYRNQLNKTEDEEEDEEVDHDLYYTYRLYDVVSQNLLAVFTDNRPTRAERRAADWAVEYLSAPTRKPMLDF